MEQHGIYETYEPRIIELLQQSDLTKVSAKKIRNQLQVEFKVNFKGCKELINKVIQDAYISLINYKNLDKEEPAQVESPIQQIKLVRTRPNPQIANEIIQQNNSKVNIAPQSIESTSYTNDKFEENRKGPQKDYYYEDRRYNHHDRDSYSRRWRDYDYERRPEPYYRDHYQEDRPRYKPHKSEHQRSAIENYLDDTYSSNIQNTRNPYFLDDEKAKEVQIWPDESVEMSKIPSNVYNQYLSYENIFRNESTPNLPLKNLISEQNVSIDYVDTFNDPAIFEQNISEEEALEEVLIEGSTKIEQTKSLKKSSTTNKKIRKKREKLHSTDDESEAEYPGLKSRQLKRSRSNTSKQISDISQIKLSYLLIRTLPKNFHSIVGEQPLTFKETVRRLWQYAKENCVMVAKEIQCDEVLRNITNRRYLKKQDLVELVNETFQKFTPASSSQQVIETAKTRDKRNIRNEIKEILKERRTLSEFQEQFSSIVLDYVDQFKLRDPKNQNRIICNSDLEAVVERQSFNELEIQRISYHYFNKHNPSNNQNRVEPEEPPANKKGNRTLQRQQGRKRGGMPLHMQNQTGRQKKTSFENVLKNIADAEDESEDEPLQTTTQYAEKKELLLPPKIRSLLGYKELTLECAATGIWNYGLRRGFVHPTDPSMITCDHVLKQIFKGKETLTLPQIIGVL